jgi:TonB family protein
MMVGMRLHRVSLLFLCLLLFCRIGSSVAVAQKTESELVASYAGKTVFLRGLWEGGRFHFRADGQPEKSYRAGSFSRSSMVVQSVKMDAHGVRIEGHRRVMIFDKDGHPEESPKGINVKAGNVRIDIDGVSGEDYGPALAAVLAPDLKALAPSLPEIWQKWVHKEIARSQPGIPTVGSPGSKANPGTKRGVTPPKVLFAPDPEFSEEARQQKFSGDVQVSLLVDEQGKPQGISIERPAGLGLDEKAVEAVSRYRFHPAMRNGVPVAFNLYIDVNFQIF